MVHNRDVRRTLLLLFLLPAVAQEPASSRVLPVLDRLNKILHEKQPAYMAWVNNGLKPLRAGEAAIRAGETSVKRLTQKAARARVAAADVVLVADFHDVDPIRRAFGRIVEDFSPAEALRSSRVALALEAVPALWEAELAKARADKRKDVLLSFFQGAWPWPVREYPTILRRERLRLAPVLACGPMTPPKVPPASTKDRERKPVLEPIANWREFKYGGHGFERNATTAKRAARWLGGAEEQRKVFILYGAAHLLDGVYPGSGIRGELEKRGYKVVVLVPFLVEWEIELRRRFRGAGEKGWYEVLPGVLRAPYVSDAEILKEWGKKD